MGSDVLVEARVCATDTETHESDAVSTFRGPKIDDCNSLLSHRGTSVTSESASWIKKSGTESCRSNGLLSRLATEDVSQGLDHGIASSSIALMSISEEKHTQRKVAKVPRNGSGSFKKLRMLQTDDILAQAEVDEKMGLDKLGAHLVKCSNAEKSAAVKQKSNVNGRRGDRRNCKVQMKAKYDPFTLKGGLPSFTPSSGGSNAFGMYGLKPDIHDVTKLIDDISLDELLDGSYKYPTHGKDKGRKAANVNENILDSVRKACSVLRLQGLQQSKKTEEMDIHDNKKISLLLSPSKTSAANGSDGDVSSLTAGLSKCSKESCVKAEAVADINGHPLYQPEDILEKLALPPPKDLDSLLQDAVKTEASGKLTDTRSFKPLSHRVTLPPFSWSNNYNGHHKSNNDTMKISNKSTCQGRWVRIRSTASFIRGGGNEGFMDLESLTYDVSLVPAGQVKYRLPEIGKTSSTFVSQDCCRQDLSSAVCSTVSLLSRALHPSSVLVAAQTLCDITTNCKKHYLNGIMKWPKQPSQKAMKARKSRSSEKTVEDFLTPKSETILDHEIRKKPKISVVQRREDFSHVQAVIGLSSVSGPRSNRSSPSKLSRDSVAEARLCNGSFAKPSFMVPPPPRAVERSNHNPQKVKKIGSIDWNRTRS